MPISVF